MGFNKTFIDWIKIVYKNPKSRVRINGDTERYTSQGHFVTTCN